jgi:hypothetical protein
MMHQAVWEMKAEIERLRAELADVQDSHECLRTFANDLLAGERSDRKEIARLREALKPFADEMYDEAGDEMPWFRNMDDNSAAFTAWGVHCDLTAGDFRRARAALAPRPPEGVVR